MKIVVVSGYFVILHKGHIRLFEEARKLGDLLVVIVNNAHQQKLKYGKVINDPNDIAYVISKLECVDLVYISNDQDKSICKTLEYIHPQIFANGGDRFKDNIPEKAVCERLGIIMEFNVGGNKINSSSEILKNAR